MLRRTVLTAGASSRVWLVLDRAATVATCVAATAILLAVFSSLRLPGPSANPAPSGAGPAAGPPTTEALSTMVSAATLGHPAATLAIVEFSDFECPACGRYARETFGRVQRELVATGKVQYVFRHFPLERIHPFAFGAAVATECAREHGRYWDMHDRLFAQQATLAPADLLTHASALGVDRGRFASCLGGPIATQVRDDIAEGRRLGVRSTPTFLIGRVQPDGAITIETRLVGAPPFAAFTSALNALSVR